MDTLSLGAFFAALHRHGIDDTTGLSVDVTGGNLSVRAYDPALSADILARLQDVRVIHHYEPMVTNAWRGVLAGVVVKLILIDAKGAAA